MKPRAILQLPLSGHSSQPALRSLAHTSEFRFLELGQVYLPLFGCKPLALLAIGRLARFFAQNLPVICMGELNEILVVKAVFSMSKPFHKSN
jgi:hypothetical protein